jgi:two-component system, chemotaxis family, CheB/CheR fusion protein
MKPKVQSWKSTEVKPVDALAAALTPESGPSQERSDAGFPIVGIGASAGGLAAFEAFFSGMPAGTDTGMAFVLVQHLAPDHRSILAGLIQRYTRMQVSEVQDGMVVKVNSAYIIPPNRDMAFLNGALHLLEPAAPRGHRLPIDFLFNSLAQDQHERAIGIVLSGTGSDGTLGVRAIKSNGGMVMAQRLASCEFDGMPRSALATGLVDYELAPAEMPAQLMAYISHAFRRPALIAVATEPQTESSIKRIFILLRAQTGHDFSQYKPSTIHRRIERRMAVQQINSIDDYVKYLQHSPVEVDALFRDFLIGVTHFFRDTDAFNALEVQGIPRLFEGKPAGSNIRIWVPGCSTGEEAYSIAILLQERLEALKLNYKLQVFATDLDSRAIAAARTGLYPASVAAAVSPERLARFFFFESDSNRYRVHKVIRQSLIFSEHDLIKDPPFSKLDLISCRNLLIYLGSSLQKRVMALFQYSLSPGGVMFLGTSETPSDSIEHFTVLDRKSKLYQRNADSQGGEHVAQGRASRILSVTSGSDNALSGMPRSAERAVVPASTLSYRELSEQALLQQVKAVGALVDGRGDIFYLHGRTGRFLEPVAGDAGINNIVKMAREGLKAELAIALQKAVRSRQLTQALGLRVRTNGHRVITNLTVCPVANARKTPVELLLYFVILEEVDDPEASAALLAATGSPVSARVAEPGVNQQIAELTEQLRAKDEHLHAMNEELETANEELKSSNEEMQSVNEELQSTNEELETSKEELQSINEELSTVNSELIAKVADLSRANNDMNNLLSGTGIATVFIDHQLRILRFTPSATPIINLILSDIGRPVSHLASNLVNYDRLVADAQNVLKTLQPKELSVQTVEGKWYNMRILPYRTIDNVIEGAVITFVENTEVVRVREALQKANEQMRLAVVVRDSFDAITVQDLDGRIIAWNPGAVSLYGWSEVEALTMNARERVPTALREEAMAQMRALSTAAILEPGLTQRLHKDGRTLQVSLVSTALIDESGQSYAIATTERGWRTPDA